MQAPCCAIPMQAAFRLSATRPCMSGTHNEMLSAENVPDMHGTGHQKCQEVKAATHGGVRTNMSSTVRDRPCKQYCVNVAAVCDLQLTQHPQVNAVS